MFSPALTEGVAIRESDPAAQNVCFKLPRRLMHSMLSANLSSPISPCVRSTTLSFLGLLLRADRPEGMRTLPGSG